MLKWPDIVKWLLWTYLNGKISTSSIEISLQKCSYEGFKAWLVEPDYMPESNPDGEVNEPSLSNIKSH